MSTLYVELLGSPRFSVDSRKISFARRRSKALLSYLVCTERRATREELADLFWPDSNASRAMGGSLRTILSEIHTCLQGGAFLLSDGGDVLYLDTAHISCDLLTFRRILESGPDLPAMREAAGLWKGGFLKGFTISSSPQDSLRGKYRKNRMCFTSISNCYVRCMKLRSNRVITSLH